MLESVRRIGISSSSYRSKFNNGKLGVLGKRDFRRFYVGYSASLLGTAMSSVAIAFAVLGGGGTASGLGIVFTANIVPLIAFTLGGGAIADRLGRRPVMLAADVARCAAQGALAVSLYLGHPAVVAVRGRGARRRRRQRVLPARAGRPASATRAARPARRRERAARRGTARCPGRGPGPGRAADRGDQPGDGGRGRRGELRDQRRRAGHGEFPRRRPGPGPGRCSRTWPTAGPSSARAPGSGSTPYSSPSSTC